MIMLVALLAVSLFPPAASAYSPYQTFYKDGYGQLVQIQNAYQPEGMLGPDIGADKAAPQKAAVQTAAAGEAPIGTLNQPQDLFVDGRDHIYIADTGNNRIVHLDEQGRLVRFIEVKESPLSSPNGLFVDQNGDIYVADTGNQRVVRLDGQGKLLREYKRPDSRYLPESFKYEPTKLVVDKRGFLYITTLGAFQGLLQLDPEGRYQSFFGSNKVKFSLFDSFKRAFYTREMYSRELSKLPGAIVNAAIDPSGFIYTVTKEIDNEQVKKFNIAGLDQLEGGGEFTPASGNKSFGETAWWAHRKAEPQLQDISVDADGNFTVIDSLYNAISQYDADGNLLFFWGSDEIEGTTKLGLVKTPASIATTSTGDLLVLDSVNSLIQRLRLTEYGSLVHQANRLTQDGRYEESEPLWAEVYRQNAYYTPALIGLAKSAFKKEQFELAEDLFLKAGVNKGYSDSFWQNRLFWFQEHFGFLMNVIAAAGILGFAAVRLSRKYGWAAASSGLLRPQSRLYAQLRHVRTLVRHPIEGYHAIRYQSGAGLASSLLMLALSIVSAGVISSQTSFIFNPKIYLGVKLGPILVQFAALWLGWVVANYLVSSLMRGEGRLRDVFYGSSYALFPIISIGIPLTIISHGFTLSEASIFGFLELAMYAWTFLQFFWMVQGIHNYSVGEAILNIVFTLLALAIIATLIFIFFSLSGELINFIYSIYQEVIIR